MNYKPILQAIKAALTPLRAPPLERLSVWAEREFYLSRESSYVERQWHAYPYQVAILDCMGHQAIEEVVFRKSARVGYTKMLLACIAYTAAHLRRTQAVWQPTDGDADLFCKRDVDTMLRDVRLMRDCFQWFGRKHKNNTLNFKRFIGSDLYIRGGDSGTKYRALSLHTAYIDELDGFQANIDNEGDAPSLVAKRLEGAPFPKLIIGSTPKVAQFPMIAAREARAQVRMRFHVPCPHCDHYHELQWGDRKTAYGMKWQKDDPESAAQLCPACGSLYTQAEYLAIWERGRWVGKDGNWIDPDGTFRNADDAIITPPHSIAFFLWTAYSPQATWPGLVADFLAGYARKQAGDRKALNTFTQQTLGEPVDEDIEQADDHELMRRAESFPLRIVPRGTLALVAGVDVQDNRFEVVVWGIGRGEEMWTVDYISLEANPADDQDWAKLDQYLLSRFPTAGGRSLPIDAAAVDTGGHFTHQAYNFCRLRARRRIYAIKGERYDGRPIKGRTIMMDVNWRGKVIQAGIKLWHVGTDTAKDLLFGRLKVEKPGPGYIHFSADLPAEFYRQLTSEARVLQKTAAGEKYCWRLRGATRNEVLDCTVYALFCSHVRDYHKYTETMWGKLEASIWPPSAAEIMEPPHDPPPRTPDVTPRRPLPPPRRPSFATGW